MVKGPLVYNLQTLAGVLKDRFFRQKYVASKKKRSGL